MTKWAQVTTNLTTGARKIVDIVDGALDAARHPKCHHLYEIVDDTAFVGAYFSDGKWSAIDETAPVVARYRVIVSPFELLGLLQRDEIRPFLISPLGTILMNREILDLTCEVTRTLILLMVAEKTFTDERAAIILRGVLSSP